MTQAARRASRSPADAGNADIAGLAKRGLSSLLGSGVSAVANLLLIVVVTRGVERETAGYFFAATSIFVVFEGLCALGTVTGMVYFIARLRARGNHGAVPALLRTGLAPVVGAVLLAAALMFGFAESLSALLNGEGMREPVGFVRILAIFLPFAVVYDVLIAATQGFHVMRPTVLLERLGRPLVQLALLSLAVTTGVALALPVAWAAPYTVGLVLAWIQVRQLLRRDLEVGHAADAGPRFVGRRRFWAYTAPRGIAAVAQLSLQRLDIVLVAMYLGAAPAAVYTAATRFVVLGQLGSQAVALAVQPKFSELMALGDIETTRRVYRVSTSWVIAVTWPIHVVVAVTAPILLTLFGPGYGGGRWVVVILAGAMLVATGCGMVTMLLVMAGKTSANLINVVVALVVNLSLNVLLIPRWGVVGAAVAWAVAIIVSNLLPLAQIQRAFGLNPFGKASFVVAGLAVTTLGLVPATGWLLGDSAVIVLGLLLVGALVYLVGLWKLRGLLELEELLATARRRTARATTPS